MGENKVDVLFKTVLWFQSSCFVHTHTQCGMCWLHADSSELGFIAFISEGQWSGVGISRQSKPLRGRRVGKVSGTEERETSLSEVQMLPPLQCSLELARAV